MAKESCLSSLTCTFFRLKTQETKQCRLGISGRESDYSFTFCLSLVTVSKDNTPKGLKMYSRLRITRTFKGKFRKLRVIGSSGYQSRVQLYTHSLTLSRKCPEGKSVKIGSSYRESTVFICEFTFFNLPGTQRRRIRYLKETSHIEFLYDIWVCDVS